MDSFLDEAKVFFTNEINQLVLHEEDKLKVFDKNSPYLATKKIGKNNPMEEQIKADNEVRQEWNRTVDRAIVSGVSEEDISRIKKNEITEKVRYSIDLYGDRPDLLASIIKLAIAVLELLITALCWLRLVWQKRCWILCQKKVEILRLRLIQQCQQCHHLQKNT